MRKLNSNGFSGLEILLIIVVIALVGGAGYYVYSQRNVDDTKTTKSSSGMERQDSPGEASVVSQEDRMVIKEWDISFKKPDSIKDLTYTYQKDSSGLEYVLLTSTDLSTQGYIENGPESSCGLGCIYKVAPKSDSPTDGYDTIEEYIAGNSYASKTIRGSLYYYDPTHASGKFYRSSLRDELQKAFISSLQ